MVRHTRAATCGLATLLLLYAAPARSTPLLPGNTGIVPTALGTLASIPNPTIVFDSGELSFAFGPAGLQVFVTFEEFIIRDPFTPLFGCGANCLDFVLQAQLNGGPAGATTLLTSVSMNTFGVSAVDVGWLLDHPAEVAPSTAARGPLGDVVSFDFSPGISTSTGNGSSQVLVIRTDRTSFSPQDFVGFAATESFPGGQTFTPSGLFSVQAQPVPEPSSMMLVAGGAVFRLLRKRRRAAKP
jgi:hypothetical protein